MIYGNVIKKLNWTKIDPIKKFFDENVSILA